MNTASLIEEEIKELWAILNQIKKQYFELSYWLFAVIVAILILSRIGLGLSSIVIAALYKVFWVSCLFFAVSCLRVAYVLLVCFFVKKGTAVVEKMEKPVRCSNVRKSDLIGCRYFMLRIAGLRVAFGIKRLNYELRDEI